jgi:hydrogenase maturation protease
MAAPPAIVVIGVGSEYRSDDSIGLVTVRDIKRLAIPGVRVIAGISDGIDLINTWESADAAIVVDGTRSGAAPGTILRFDAITDQIPEEVFSSCSTHAFSITEAVVLARMLDRLPRMLIVYGVEAGSILKGVGLTSDVAAVLPEVVARIKEEINRLTRSLAQAAE